jgi:hypothetical protein
MIIFLMLISAFLISTRQSPRSFARSDPACGGAGLTQGNWYVRFHILDGPVFMTPDVGPAFLGLGHEDVEGGLWAPLRLVSFVFLPLVIFHTFCLDHPRRSLFSYDNLLALGRLGLRWPTRTFFPSSSTMFMFTGNRSLLSFIWGLSTNFNRPSFMAD